MPGFPPTRHSVIERMRSVDTAARRDAFGDLVEGYWKPLYKIPPAPLAGVGR